MECDGTLTFRSKLRRRPANFVAYDWKPLFLEITVEQSDWEVDCRT